MAGDLSDPVVRNNYLKEEYLFLQGQYEDFDKRALQIKGWVSAGSIAGLAAAFAPKHPSLFIPIAVAIIVGFVWYLEAYWRTFQYAFQDRIKIIEAHFRGDPKIILKDPVPFQIYDSWYKSYKKNEPIYVDEPPRIKELNKRIWLAARHRYVYFPYVPIMILCAFAILIIALQRFHVPLPWHL
jgi:hypothetical protein